MRTIFAFFLLLALIAGCSRGPIVKAQLDAEVKRLCAIDGGIKVYETVKLPVARFDKYGNIQIPSKDKAKPEDDFYYEWEHSYLIKGNPEMWRDNYKIYRRQDRKLLGEDISYIRRGGDLYGPWHDTSFSCSDFRESTVSLEKSIFVREK